MQALDLRPRAVLCALAFVAGLAPVGSASAKAGQVPDAAKVTLLSAGKGAKTVLRITPKKGQKQTVVMTMEIEMAMAMGAMKMPPIKAPVTELDMQLVVTKVEANGDIRYNFEFSDTRVIDDSGLPPQAVDQMKKSLHAMKGIKGYAVVDSSGQTKEADFTTGGDLEPQVAQMLDNIRQSMNQLTAPFPKQPVGVGAKWTVETRLDQMGFPLKQVATYELSNLKGHRGTLQVGIEQRTTSSDVQLPNLPPGAKAKVLSLESTGSGQVKFDLRQLGPLSSTSGVSSNIRTELQAQGQTQIMEMDMKMKIRLKSK